MKLSHETRYTRERHQASKQASNKKQREPIDEGTKNSTSLTNHSLPHTSLFLMMMMTMMYLIGVGLMTSSNMSDIKRIGDRVSVSVLADENDDDEEG